jgi:hypothetical protein
VWITRSVALLHLFKPRRSAANDKFSFDYKHINENTTHASLCWPPTAL